MSQETPKNTYVTLHKNFVRTDIEHTDRRTGETRTFNSVTLPKGTVIDGRDVSYYQFSPLFVNESRYRGEDYRDIPLLTNREVWLRRSILDKDGKPVVNEEGVKVKDVYKRQTTGEAPSPVLPGPRCPSLPEESRRQCHQP